MYQQCNLRMSHVEEKAVIQYCELKIHSPPQSKFAIQQVHLSKSAKLETPFNIQNYKHNTIRIVLEKTLIKRNVYF